MKYVLIIHEVNDYAGWKKIFDAAIAIRKEAGEISYQVFQIGQESNSIVHFSIWTSHHAARTFFESDELIRVREAGGVKSPQFLYLEQLEAGVL